MIDTHVLWWMLTEPSRLSEELRQTLADRRCLLLESDTAGRAGHQGEGR